MRHTSNSEKRRRATGLLKVKNNYLMKDKLTSLQVRPSTALQQPSQIVNKANVQQASAASISPRRDSSQREKLEMQKLLKLLNKPEMLLLSHLQTQFNYYYPQKMNKHLTKDQIDADEKKKKSFFVDTVEKQRKLI
jgi:hypothetical protein